MDLERVRRTPRMDLERIERALREGPPDEPVYVPGSFRRARRPWSVAVAAATGLIAVALVVAFASRIGGWLPGDVGASPVPSAIVPADLQGTWQTDPISFQAWRDALLERGFSDAEIDSFLEHDPFSQQVRYQLRFIGSQLIIQALYDDLPVVTLTPGTYTIDGATLRFTETIEGVPSAGCRPVAAATLAGDRLSLRLTDLSGCGTDERIANTLFFDLWPLTKAGS